MASPTPPRRPPTSDEKRLAELYSESAREVPSPALDERILQAAREAVTDAPGRQPARRRPRWLPPLAAAATLVVGVGLGYRLIEQSGEPEPAPSMQAPGTPSSEAVGQSQASGQDQAGAAVEEAESERRGKVARRDATGAEGTESAALADEPNSRPSPAPAPRRTDSNTGDDEAAVTGGLMSRPTDADRTNAHHDGSASPAAELEERRLTNSRQNPERLREQTAESDLTLRSEPADKPDAPVSAEAATEAPAEATAARGPADLLEDIETLINAGRPEQARALLEHLRERFPETEIPSSVTAALEQDP